MIPRVAARHGAKSQLSFLQQRRRLTSLCTSRAILEFSQKTVFPALPSSSSSLSSPCSPSQFRYFSSPSTASSPSSSHSSFFPSLFLIHSRSAASLPWCLSLHSAPHLSLTHFPSYLRPFSSSPSSSEASSVSWVDKMKSWFSPSSSTSSSDGDEFTLDKFAEELKRARRFGQIAQFGKGLPKGGEAVVARSLEKQELIIRAMTPSERADPSANFREAERERVAKEMLCSRAEVDATIEKFEWFKEAHRRVQILRAAGKPLPKSFEEIEALMGGKWNAKASRSFASSSSQVSRNAPCPCGSKKRYKRCCGVSS